MRNPPTPTFGSLVQMLGIQGNLPTVGFDFNLQRRAVLDHHVRETYRANALIRAEKIKQPMFVVWPDNSSDIDPTRNHDAATEIVQTVNCIGVSIIVSVVLQQPAGHISNTP